MQKIGILVHMFMTIFTFIHYKNQSNLKLG